mgnify:CR=1 FL=1
MHTRNNWHCNKPKSISLHWKMSMTEQTTMVSWELTYYRHLIRLSAVALTSPTLSARRGSYRHRSFPPLQTRCVSTTRTWRSIALMMAATTVVEIAGDPEAGIGKEPLLVARIRQLKRLRALLGRQPQVWKMAKFLTRARTPSTSFWFHGAGGKRSARTHGSATHRNRSRPRARDITSGPLARTCGPRC